MRKDKKKDNQRNMFSKPNWENSGSQASQCKSSIKLVEAEWSLVCIKET